MKKRGLLCGVLALFGLLLIGATNRPLGTNPFSGGREESGFSIHVVDEDIDDDVFEVVDADTGFTPMAADTTIKVFYEGGNGDTALVRIWGIRPKNVRSANDTLRSWTELLKVDGGDTVTTDSIYHAFNQAWLDTGEASAVRVWPAGQSNTAKRLRTIPARRISAPIAQFIFGGDDSPEVSSIEVGMSRRMNSMLDSVAWSQGGSWPKIDTLVGDSDADTSLVIPIQGAQSIGYTWKTTVKDGSLAGGGYSLTITPQVSHDSTNWFSLISNAVFTKTASANGTTIQVLYNTAGDTILAGGRNIAYIDGSRFLRWIAAYSVDTYIAGVSDSTFIALIQDRQYQPGTIGISYELRVYPNIENPVNYAADYWVMEQAYVNGSDPTKVFSWPNGLRLPKRTMIAVVARGDIDNMAGYATITGNRRTRQ